MNNRMLRMLVGVAAAVGLLFGASGIASAGIFNAIESTLSVQLGSLQTLTVTGKYKDGGYAFVSNNGSKHDLQDLSSIWASTSVFAGTSLLTGVTLLWDLQMNVIKNEAATFTASFTGANAVGPGSVCLSGPCLGGTEPVRGSMVLWLGPDPNDASEIPFTFTLKPTPSASPFGTGGFGQIGHATFPITPSGAGLIVDAGSFVTGKVKFTGITTNVIKMPGRGGVTGVGLTLRPTSAEEVQTFTTGGGFVTSATGTPPLMVLNTLTVAGTNVLSSASNGGTVSLIAPMTIDTGPLNVGNLPGLTIKRFVFHKVPEPGTVLLLVSGAAGLVFLGRRRMRK